MKKTLQLFIFVVIYASNAIAANIPTFGDLSKNIIYLNSGKNQLLISNVGDGDNTAQPIVFTGSSSDETVVKVDSVGYKAGDKVAILYLSEQQKAGSAIITVTATDAEGSFQDTKQVQVEQYNQYGARLRFYDIQFWKPDVPNEGMPCVYDTVVSNTYPPLTGYYNSILDKNQEHVGEINSYMFTTDYNNIELSAGPSMNGPKWRYFKATLTGYLLPTKSGNYKFTLHTNEGGLFKLSTTSSQANFVDRATTNNSDSTTGNISLVAGKIYAFYVLNTIIESAGIQLYWESAENSIAKQIIPNENILNIYDLVKPTVPSGIATTLSSKNYISVKWNPSTDNEKLVGYNIYLNGVKANTEVLTDTKYSFSSLTPGTQYSITVTSVDKMGNESNQSAIYNETTSIDESNPPFPPTSLQVLQKTGLALKVKWAGAYDVDTKINGYNLYVNGLKYNTDVLLTDSIVLVGLQQRTIYNVQVEAIDAAANISEKSQIFPATTATFDPTGLSLGEKRLRAKVKMENIGWNDGIGVNLDYGDGRLYNDLAYQKVALDMYPGVLRWGAIDANSMDFATHVGLGKTVTYGQFFSVCNKANAWMALTVGVHNGLDYITDSTTFLKLMEYLAGPSSSTWGAVRASEGFEEPFLKDGKGVIIEFGNEVWGAAAHNAEIGADYTKYTKWARMAAKTIKQSPYYETYKDKIILTVSGRNPGPADSWGQNTNALKGGTDEFDCLATAGYLGGNLNYDPKVEKGATELEYNKLRVLQAYDNITGMTQTMKAEMIPLTGSIKKFYFYESNATTSYYNGRYGQALVSVDYYAESMNKGSIVPTIFHLSGGEWRVYQLENSKPLPMYILSQYMNKYSKGHILKTEFETNSYLSNSLNKPITDYSPVGIHSYANGSNYTVWLFNRDFENNYTLQLDLPNDFTFSSSAKIYKFSAQSFSDYDMAIDSSDFEISDSMFIEMPKYSVCMIKFTGEDKAFAKLPLGYFKHVMPTSLVLKTNTGDTIIKKGGTQLVLTPVVEPADVFSNSVSYKFIRNNVGSKFLSVGTNSSKVLPGTCNDTIIVRCSLKEDPNVYDDITLVMTGYSTCGADINESSTEMFNLFPNPVNNMLQIKSNIAGMLNAEVFDFSGRMVLRKQVANESMDLSQLEAGMYLVKISNKEQSKTFRIIKK